MLDKFNKIMEKKQPHEYTVDKSIRARYEENKEVYLSQKTKVVAINKEDIWDEEDDEENDDDFEVDKSYTNKSHHSSATYTTLNADSAPKASVVELPRCDFDQKFLAKDDVKLKARTKYYDSLKVDLDELDYKLNQKYEQKEYLRVSIIAEKPSIARRIAEVLSGDSFEIQQWQGFRTLYFNGYFREFEASFRVMSTFGHIYKDNFDQSEDWNIFEADPTSLLQEEQIYPYLARYNERRFRGGPDFSRIEEYLSYYLGGSDVVLLWLDNDITGENI